MVHSWRPIRCDRPLASRAVPGRCNHDRATSPSGVHGSRPRLATGAGSSAHGHRTVRTGHHASRVPCAENVPAPLAVGARAALPGRGNRPRGGWSWRAAGGLQSQRIGRAPRGRVRCLCRGGYRPLGTNCICRRYQMRCHACGDLASGDVRDRRGGVGRFGHPRAASDDASWMDDRQSSDPGGETGGSSPDSG